MLGTPGKGYRLILGNQWGLVWEQLLLNSVFCSLVQIRAKKVVRQLQSYVKYLDRGFYLHSASGSLCFPMWVIQSTVCELHHELLLFAGIQAIKIVHTWFPKILLQINKYERGCIKIYTGLSKCYEAYVCRETVLEKANGKKMSF